MFISYKQTGEGNGLEIEIFQVRNPKLIFETLNLFIKVGKVLSFKKMRVCLRVYKFHLRM